jgi:hypothetical protein
MGRWQPSVTPAFVASERGCMPTSPPEVVVSTTEREAEAAKQSSSSDPSRELWCHASQESRECDSGAIGVGRSRRCPSKILAIFLHDTSASGS